MQDPECKHNDWRAMTSVEAVCARYSERMRALLAALDLSRPGLENVMRAFERDALPEACSALLAYYREGSSGAWLRKAPAQDAMESQWWLAGLDRRPLAVRRAEQEREADAICEDRLTLNWQTWTIPRNADGLLDWSCKGPTNDPEWAWSLNRHYHLDTLMDVHGRTGNVKYVRKVDEALRDWVIGSQPYAGKQGNLMMWRGIEVSFRVKAWARIFYRLQDNAELTDAARLLILSSLPEHADYALKYHQPGGNWLTMEMSGLAMAGAAWPEFRDSARWIDYAKAALCPELTKQVYPDGAQTELACNYHRVSLTFFDEFAQTCRQAGVALPKDFVTRLEDMWNYLACVMKPDGGQPINNDSNSCVANRGVELAADAFGREDWRHIATNGREGKAPQRPPSVFFPWAGQLIMRSGYDAEAQWAFFDAGPWGAGHQHNDKLHLSVYAGGRDLLVDGGVFAYFGTLSDKFRGAYALHSAGHNVILVDGHGQGPGPRIADSPLPEADYRVEDAFDFARGSMDQFEQTEGKIKHTRAVLYARGEFWVVVDRIETDRPRDIEVLWHWHPDCAVEAEGSRVVSTDAGKGNLAILPVGDIEWNVKIVKGQEEPRLQGWHSERYNNAEPSPAAVYSAHLEGSANFVWLLFPAKGKVPRVEASITSQSEERVVVRVVDARGNPCEAFAPLSGEGRPALRPLGK